MAVGPAVYALLWWVINRTRWGVWVRAASRPRDRGALGLNEPLLFTPYSRSVHFSRALQEHCRFRAKRSIADGLGILIEAFVVVVVVVWAWHRRILVSAADRNVHAFGAGGCHSRHCVIFV